MKKRTRKHGQAFWESEYKDGGYLALSVNPSEDLEKFTRWLTREYGNSILNVTASVLDLGCGNGRNLVWLGENFNVRGVGFDISSEAIKQAERRTKELELSFTYEARSIAGILPVADESQAIVLDMMTSHFLKAAERAALIEEIHRVLKPGGFLFYKTFLLDEDRHAKRMLKENPADEENSYVHPEIGVAEHVSTEAEIDETYGKFFTIHKIYKSHRHTGKFAKRRSVSIYLEKPAY